MRSLKHTHAHTGHKTLVQDFQSNLKYLNQNKPTPNVYLLFTKGYEDNLQSLMNNLECQTTVTHTKVFEKDPIIYFQHQQCIYLVVCPHLFEQTVPMKMSQLIILSSMSCGEVN